MPAYVIVQINIILLIVQNINIIQTLIVQNINVIRILIVQIINIIQTVGVQNYIGRRSFLEE